MIILNINQVSDWYIMEIVLINLNILDASHPFCFPSCQKRTNVLQT